MGDLLLLLGIAFVAAYFWQFRAMAEISQRFTKQACQQQNVQFIVCALESAKPSLGTGYGLGWKAKYLFEFSTDGINELRGYVWLQGKQVSKIEWPVFPEPDWQGAPESKGKVCGGCR